MTDATTATTATELSPVAAAPAPKGRRPKTRGKGTPAKGRKATVKPPVAKGPATRRTGTKQEQLIAMLSRKDGAPLDEMVKAFGWQPHTVRGAIAGALKKKLGMNVASEKIEGRGRVYRIED